MPSPRVAARGGLTARKANFSSLVHGVRWTTLATGLVVAPVQGPLAAKVVAWGLILLGYATWRTVRPLDLKPERPRPGTWGYARMLAPFVVDVGLPAAAVATTGYWESPYAFCLLTGVLAAALAHGFGFAIRLAIATSVGVSLPYHLSVNGSGGNDVQLTGQWVMELVLVAVLAGYARRLFGDAERRHSRDLDRMARLGEANELLVSLHRVAQSLPASLSLETTLASTVSRLRSVIPSDVTAVLLRDDATGRWLVASAHGIPSNRQFADGDLPEPLAATARSSVASLVVCLGPGTRLGPELLSHTGLYAPLRARGNLIGLVALEHHEPGTYGRRELQLLDGFVESAALAIDNARWFARLREIGADEERVRIARDMHDRLGQSLATLAFSLDHIRRRVDDPDLRKELDHLRTDVRATVADVRETLGDLRTDVTDERGLVDALSTFLERVEGRTGLEVNFSHSNGSRLPLVQEREMLRIAQEAIANVERHAAARHLSVRWEFDGSTATLAIADDGSGFDVSDRRRRDSYGLTGMRERANAIGAALEIDSAPGGGTVVLCRVGGGR